MIGRQKAVVDEVLLVDGELRVARIEVTGPVVENALPQDQILRPGRRANRVRLYEAKRRNRRFERSGPEQRTGKCVPTQVGQGDGADLDSHAFQCERVKVVIMRPKAAPRAALIRCSAARVHDIYNGCSGAHGVFCRCVKFHSVGPAFLSPSSASVR